MARERLTNSSCEGLRFWRRWVERDEVRQERLARALGWQTTSRPSVGLLYRGTQTGRRAGGVRLTAMRLARRLTGLVDAGTQLAVRRCRGVLVHARAMTRRTDEGVSAVRRASGIDGHRVQVEHERRGEQASQLSKEHA